MYLISSVFQCFSNFNVHVVHLWLLLKCRFLFSVCMCMCVCVFSHVWLFVAPGLYLPGSCIHRISQAKILERVDISYSRGSSHPLDWTCIFCISCIAGGFFTTLLPFLFSRSGQIYWISNKQTGDGPATKTVLWISLVQLLSHVWLFVTPWTPCPSPNPGDCSNSCSSICCCHLTVSSSVIPVSSFLQSFPGLNQGLFQWVSSSHKVT